MCEGEALLNPHGRRSAWVPEAGWGGRWGRGGHGWLIEVAVTIFRSLGILSVRTFDFFLILEKKKKENMKAWHILQTATWQCKCCQREERGRQQEEQRT